VLHPRHHSCCQLVVWGSPQTLRYLERNFILGFFKRVYGVLWG
jgi:hypothetical protein